MYRIDVPAYHWDNDYFQIGIRVLHFASLERAKKFQAWLRSLRYEADPLLCHPLVRAELRNANTAEIPHPNSREGRSENYDKIDIYSGVIIEASFDVYTEEVIRTKIGT